MHPVMVVIAEAMREREAFYRSARLEPSKYDALAAERFPADVASGRIRIIEQTENGPRIQVLIREPWASRAANRCTIRLVDGKLYCNQRGHGHDGCRGIWALEAKLRNEQVTP